MGIKQLLIISFLSLLLLANVSLAQISTSNILNSVTSILINFSGIIFIVVFVVILLIIGGVFPKPSGGIPWGIIIFFILIILVFFIPQFITFPDYMKDVPASFKFFELPEAAKDGLQLMGLPREWGFIPAILYLFILPFAAVYTLVWAFLNTLGIFDLKHINRILAFIISFMTIPLGVFTKMVWALFGFMGIWSLVVFVAMFVAGVFFRGAGHVTKEYNEYRKLVMHSKVEIEELIKQLEAARQGTIQEMNTTIVQVLNEKAFMLGADAQRKLRAAGVSPDRHEKAQLMQEAADIMKRSKK